MSYWCSDHRQWERDSPHTPDSVANELHAENKQLRVALAGVLAEADRKTAAFERAHAVLGNVVLRDKNATLKETTPEP